MGARGPKPIPTQLKLARGTFRSGRAPASEAPALGKPTCPSWVKDADAKKEFRRLARVLGEMGLVGSADSNLLTRYCIDWVRWRRVTQTLLTNGAAEYATYKDADGKVKSVQVSALHSVARSLSDELSRAEQQLGMTPSARSRIEVAPPPPSSAPVGKDKYFDIPFGARN